MVATTTTTVDSTTGGDEQGSSFFFSGMFSGLQVQKADRRGCKCEV